MKIDPINKEIAAFIKAFKVHKVCYLIKVHFYVVDNLADACVRNKTATAHKYSIVMQ